MRFSTPAAVAARLFSDACKVSMAMAGSIAKGFGAGVGPLIGHIGFFHLMSTRLHPDWIPNAP
jgi:hypothetical protein